MIANYGICVQCSELLEDKAGMWRDIDGHSFSLVPIDGTDGFRHHIHKPFTEENYKSLGKYSSLDAEILDSLAMHGYASDAVGDQSTFGFFDLFSEYQAILISHPNGSVDAVFYDSHETTERIWNDIVSDYEKFDDVCYTCGNSADHSEAACQGDNEPLYDEYGDDNYAYESGAYESDLWD